MCHCVHNNTATIITKFPPFPPPSFSHPSPSQSSLKYRESLPSLGPPQFPFPYTGTENCGKTNHLHRLLRTRDESERVFTYLRLQLGGGDFRILEEVLWACIAFPDE